MPFSSTSPGVMRSTRCLMKDAETLTTTPLNLGLHAVVVCTASVNQSAYREPSRTNSGQRSSIHVRRLLQRLAPRAIKLDL